MQTATALHRQGRLGEAKAIYESILAKQPNHFDALNLLGAVAAQTRNYQAALVLFGRAIAVDPEDPSAQNNLGNVFLDLKKFDEALASYDKALALNPRYAEAYNNRGNALKALSRLDVALSSYDKALACKPDFAEARNNRGAVLQGLGRLGEALASYEQALALQPNYAAACYNRGNVLLELRRADEALACYDKVLTFNLGGGEEIYNNRGNALKELNRLQEALLSYGKALVLNPNYAQAYNNQGSVLLELRRPNEALASFDKALAVNANYPEANYNHGNALLALRRLDEAIASFDKALALKPDYAEAYNNRGNALKELNHLNEALADYGKALTLSPDNPVVHYNLGNAAFDLKRLDEALISYEAALALKPDYEFLQGTQLLLKMQVCAWQDMDSRVAQLESDIRAGKRVSPPFPVLGILDAPNLQRKVAELYAEAQYPTINSPAVFAKRDRGQRIRVGYFSADFHNHATTYLMAELLEVHDKSKFELFGFSFGPDKDDPMRKRVSAAFDRLDDVRTLGDREIAQRARNLGIDIAVDLKGYTRDARPGIFAHRCAPIQVNYLGFPGTMGTNHIDYLIADKIVVPHDRQSDYAEKIVYLPNSYQVNDSSRKISERIFTRQEVGLPETGFIFCCFNNNYKILPTTFTAWMELLKAVEGSVLWLFENNPTAAKNLRSEAESRGIDSRRLVFATYMPLDEHLARHRLADLFIDTLPYNAHTTASDALWAGTPVLTRTGRSFASRVSSSLLHACGLPELVTYSLEDFTAKAIELATNAEELSRIKKKLAANRLSAPLFNTSLFARHIEAAYEAMYERFRCDLSPETIEVDTIQNHKPGERPHRDLRSTI